MTSAKDPSSLSNPTQVRVKHISLQLTVDFANKTLSGHADYRLQRLSQDADKLILDTNSIDIKHVYKLDAASGETKEVSFEQQPGPLGGSLSIPLEAGSDSVRIAFSTSPDASAIQWLTPSQTLGKKHPYLFTQCQAIHARSVIPCQDTPSVKFTYDAVITVPKELTALMSARIDRVDEPVGDHRTYRFDQPKPIPSYLLALAVGELVSRDIGPRSKLWSEAAVADQAADEFAETETFLKTAEDIAGPYEWGSYDLLLLPPSFPYGGMENPQLTFVTPTLLAGDRSNAGVVAHEISHSWTGNLVTTRNWEHFWLNEGFTVFLERKILQKLKGPQQFHLDALLGWETLERSVQTYGPEHPFTALVPVLNDIDPDDAFSSVPYEKGFNFLFYLQQLVGDEALFDKFFKDWIQTHKTRENGVDSNDFKAYFLSYFKPTLSESALSSIDWDTWFNAPGMPKYDPKFDTTLANASQDLVSKWTKEGGANASPDDIKGWSAKQIRYFLDKLLAENALSHSILEKLDENYKFTLSANAEIQEAWYKIGIKAEWEKVLEPSLKFITSQGRMKFVRPLYRALFNSAMGKDRAVSTFKENRNFYHIICSKMLAKDLQLE